ncbi:hypothetical protein B0H14DRAFT_3885393 [Mycena olivaceomarginata]|nr:hypothetical protein B0H14DRAFT_3885393 [Mycena olivaceomarginata]
MDAFDAETSIDISTADGVHQFAQGMAAYRALWAKDATAYSERVIAVPAPRLTELGEIYTPAFVSAAVLAALMDAVCNDVPAPQTDALALHTA